MTAQTHASRPLFSRERRAGVSSSQASPASRGTEATDGIQVRTAHPGDEPRPVSTLTLAFSADPAARWAFPTPADYLTHFPEFVRAFGGRAFACGTAHFIGDSQAAALWLPPGVEPDEDDLMNLFRRIIPEQNQETLFAMFEQMGKYHPPEPHWYLPLIGVDPAQQRRGYGSMLLEHALKVCDQDRTPAYLESSNPENIPLYHRHGFEVLGTIQVGASPPVTPMLRRSR